MRIRLTHLGVRSPVPLLPFAGIGLLPIALCAAVTSGSNSRSSGTAVTRATLGAAETQVQSADSLYAAARAALNAKDYRQAAELFRKVHQRHPESEHAPLAYYWEAFSLYRAGTREDLKAAVELLQTQREQLQHAREDLEATAERLRAQSERLQQATRGEAAALLVRVHSALARLGEAESLERLTAEALRESATADAPLDSCPSENDDARIIALQSLLRHDADRALSVVQTVLARRDSCSATVRLKVLSPLAMSGLSEATDMLSEVAVDDPDPDVRQRAVFMLSQVRDEAALEALEQIARTSDDQALRHRALFGLAQQRRERASQLLRDIAADEDMPIDLRRRAVFWLGEGSTAESPSFLESLLTRMESSQLKGRVVSALYNRAQRDDPQALQAIEVLFKIGQSDPDAELRRRAVWFLSRLDDPRAIELLRELHRPPDN